MIFLLAKLLVLSLCLVLTYAYGVRSERQLMGRMALGGRRPRLLWPLIDLYRALTKPDLTAGGGAAVLRTLGPALAFGMLFIGYALLPTGPTVAIGGLGLNPTLIGRDMDLASLLLFGWMPLFGVLMGVSGLPQLARPPILRQLARSVGFAVPLLLSGAGCASLAGTSSVSELVVWQGAHTWLIVYQPLAFLLACVSVVAGAQRMPIALQGQRITSQQDFHLQHAGGHLALYHMVEHLGLIWFAMVLSTLFLGGWQGPWLAGIHWLGLKGVLVYLFLLWLRRCWVVPRMSARLDRFWWWLILFNVINLMVTLVALSAGGVLR